MHEAEKVEAGAEQNWPRGTGDIVSVSCRDKGALAHLDIRAGHSSGRMFSLGLGYPMFAELFLDKSVASTRRPQPLRAGPAPPFQMELPGPGSWTNPSHPCPLYPDVKNSGVTRVERHPDKDWTKSAMVTSGPSPGVADPYVLTPLSYDIHCIAILSLRKRRTVTPSHVAR